MEFYLPNCLTKANMPIPAAMVRAVPMATLVFSPGGETGSRGPWGPKATQ
jgi:hypothetical protein